MMKLSVFRATAALACAVHFAAAGEFLRKTGPVVTTEEAEASLASMLAGNSSSDRLASLEESLRSTYAALPRGEGGLLGYQAVRYALHRLLLQRHGWFVVGLEPSDEAPPPYLQGEWVPSYLQGVLEARLGSSGIDLHELAALAAALEDLVKQETAQRVKGVYGLLNLPLDQHLGPDRASEVLTTYLMTYLGANFSQVSPQSLQYERRKFAVEYDDWSSAEAWLQDVEGPYLASAKSTGLDIASVFRAADELGERFGAFNDGECRSLKTTLLGMEEGRRPGRVLLSDFYRKGLHSHWDFDEKVEYLRQLGALDESEPSFARVIVPNYLGSRTNCLQASGLYSVCCRNECEDLMRNLEHQIAGPDASAQRIADIVAAMPSDSVQAPWNLSSSLLGRLREIEAEHSGRVPLHGRLFAQWMHHAYPRECPYPHEAGTISPQTPDEWMREMGQEDTKATLEERMQHVASNTCSGPGPCKSAQAGSAGGSGHQEDVELPWSSAESLLVMGDGAKKRKPRLSQEFTLLLAVLLSLIALKLALTSRQRGAERRVAEAKLWDSERQCKPQVDWHMITAFACCMAAATLTGIFDASAFVLAVGVGAMALAGPRLMARAKPSPKAKLEEDRV